MTSPDGETFCVDCPHCIGEAARALIGSPCEVCGKELTELSYSTSRPGMCAWCLSTWQPPVVRSGPEWTLSATQSAQNAQESTQAVRNIIGRQGNGW